MPRATMPIARVLVKITIPSNLIYVPMESNDPDYGQDFLNQLDYDAEDQYLYIERPHIDDGFDLGKEFLKQVN